MQTARTLHTASAAGLRGSGVCRVPQQSAATTTGPGKAVGSRRHALARGAGDGTLEPGPTGPAPEVRGSLPQPCGARERGGGGTSPGSPAPPASASPLGTPHTVPFRRNKRVGHGSRLCARGVRSCDHGCPGCRRPQRRGLRAGPGRRPVTQAMSLAAGGRTGFGTAQSKGPTGGFLRPGRSDLGSAGGGREGETGVLSFGVTPRRGRSPRNRTRGRSPRRSRPPGLRRGGQPTGSCRQQATGLGGNETHARERRPGRTAGPGARGARRARRRPAGLGSAAARPRRVAGGAGPR